MRINHLLTALTASVMLLTGCQYNGVPTTAGSDLETLNEEYGIYKGGPDIFGTVVDKDNISTSRTVMIPTGTGGVVPSQRTTTKYYLYAIREGEDSIREYEVSAEEYRKCQTNQYFYHSGRYKTITCDTAPIVGSKTYFGEYDEDGNPVANDTATDEAPQTDDSLPTDDGA